MKRGQKPTPKALRLLRGNPSKRPISQSEPDGVGDLWRPPSYMNAAQRRVWDSVIGRAPWLTGTDTEIVEAFVNAVVEYRRAVVEVQKGGQVVETKQGNAIVNPYLGIQNRQADLVRKFGGELGLSPASRAALGSAIDASRRTIDGGSIADYLAQKPAFFGDREEMT